jgi:general secretion pathway protein F
MAVRPDGGRAIGLRRAKDARALADLLRKDRLVPLQSWSLPSWASIGAADRAAPLKDQGEIHTQLAQLLSRAVPLVEALEVVASSTSARTRPRVERARDLVAAGSAFADACAKVSLFDPVTIAVLRAAERTGDLAGAAQQLATTVRRQLAVRGKVVTLLLYPAIVTTVMILVASGMLMFVVPRVVEGLRQLGNGQQLPAFTLFMSDLGLFLRGQWPWVLAAVVLVVMVGIALRKRLNPILQSFIRTVPVLRDVIMAQESARFFTVMAAMTRSGVTLADALGTATGAIGHPLLKTQLVTLRTRLIEGGVLRTLIDQVTALPLPTRRLLIAAERAGDLETAFDTLAEDLTIETDRRSSRLLAVLEPLLIVILFLFIGALMLSLMLPVLQSAAAQVG